MQIKGLKIFIQIFIKIYTTNNKQLYLSNNAKLEYNN